MNKHWLDRLSFTLFPARCLLCESPSNLPLDLCQHCFSLLRRDPNYCRHCGLDLATASDHCGHCLQQPPAFDRCVSGCSYHRLSASLIHRFKDHKELPPLRILCALLVDEIIRAYQGDTMPALILPIPLHWQRLWHRGFNQSQWIAHALSRQLHIPSCNNTIKRHQATPYQRKLNKQRRLRNLQGAFSITTDVSQYRHVVIVDDVTTTGSTCQAVATLLKQHGVTRVDCWSLARTPEPSSKG